MSVSPAAPVSAAPPAAAAASPAPATAGIAGTPGSNLVHVRIIGINDFHGQLPDSTASINDQAVGGAATLAAYIKRARAEVVSGGSIMVSSGDAFGASPPESQLLRQEPAIAVLAAMGLDVATLGNHEFDAGWGELTRLLTGVADARSGAAAANPRRKRRKKGGAAGAAAPAAQARQAATLAMRTRAARAQAPARAGAAGKVPTWPGSPFPWVSSNVVDAKSGKHVLPPYAIREINGIKVGIVGAVTRNLKNVTIKKGNEAVRTIDEAAAINAAVKQLKAQGVETIVVTIHEGGEFDKKTGTLSGPIVDIMKKLDKSVDAVMSGHSHQEYVAKVDGRVVVQGLSYAKAFSQVDLAVDPRTGDVVASSGKVVHNLEKGIAPDPAVAALVKTFEEAVAPRTQRVVSNLPGAVTRKPSPAGESALGTLIAEAQRWFAGADVGIMNPGGIRQDIGEGGPIKWGTLFGVQPFANHVVTLKMSGAKLKAVLEQMFRKDAHANVMLQLAGMRVTYDPSKPLGQRILSVTMDDGSKLDPKREYTVACNSFLADGGDGFTELKGLPQVADSGIDLDALVAYLEAGNPVPTGPIGRLTTVGGAAPAPAH